MLFIDASVAHPAAGPPASCPKDFAALMDSIVAQLADDLDRQVVYGDIPRLEYDALSRRYGLPQTTEAQVALKNQNLDMSLMTGGKVRRTSVKAAAKNMGAVERHDDIGLYYERIVSPVESVILRRKGKTILASVKFDAQASARTFSKSLPPLPTTGAAIYPSYRGGAPIDVALRDLNLSAGFKDQGGIIKNGVNATKTIRKLKSLGEHPVKELEKTLRPKAASEDGFLGARESLVERLAEDNAYVVDKLKLTHQKLAKDLIHLTDLYNQAATINHQPGRQLVSLNGKRYAIDRRGPYMGHQRSPFGDPDLGAFDYTIYNLENGHRIEFSDLVPMLIHRYGFYEGKGTTYRLAPEDLVKVLYEK